MLDSTTTLDRDAASSFDTAPSCHGSHREAEREARHDAQRLAHEIVARFVRDPAAFAQTVRADDPSAFLRDYRQGLDRRLTALVGAPRRMPERLATMGPPTLDAPADWLTTRRPDGESSPDSVPRMGPVVVAAAVVTAATAVVQAAVAVYTLLTKHKPL